MKKRLAIRGFLRFLSGLAIVFAMLFVSAGSFEYVQGYIFMCTVFVPILICGLWLLLKNPELLEKRLNTKEKSKSQKGVVTASLFMFIAAFLAAGLCARFEYLMLPIWVSILGAVIYLFGYVLYALVLLENKYLSRTVEKAENQTVIDTGLYSVVRHPMYTSTLLLFMSMPLMLGSVLSFVILCVYPFLISVRIRHEEMLLENELCGYREYKERVKYKIIPFIW